MADNVACQQQQQPLQQLVVHFAYELRAAARLIQLQFDRHISHLAKDLGQLLLNRAYAKKKEQRSQPLARLDTRAQARITQAHAMLLPHTHTHIHATCNTICRSFSVAKLEPGQDAVRVARAEQKTASDCCSTGVVCFRCRDREACCMLLLPCCYLLRSSVVNLARAEGHFN